MAIAIINISAIIFIVVVIPHRKVSRRGPARSSIYVAPFGPWRLRGAVAQSHSDGPWKCTLAYCVLYRCVVCMFLHACFSCHMTIKFIYLQVVTALRLCLLACEASGIGQ
jgi:hypothetical protein